MDNTTRINLERRIVKALIRHMSAAGFSVSNVFDSGVHYFPATIEGVLDAVFAVDEASLRFVQTSKLAAYDKARKVNERPSQQDYDGFHIGGEWGKAEHGVLLVLGNGEDVISDWNYFSDDRDGFNAAMAAFDQEKAISYEALETEVAKLRSALETIEGGGSTDEGAEWARGVASAALRP
jgi:hypothetical protein